MIETLDFRRDRSAIAIGKGSMLYADFDAHSEFLMKLYWPATVIIAILRIKLNVPNSSGVTCASPSARSHPVQNGRGVTRRNMIGRIFVNAVEPCERTSIDINRSRNACTSVSDSATQGPGINGRSKKVVAKGNSIRHFAVPAGDIWFQPGLT
jgi:hypothetical protein